MPIHLSKIDLQKVRISHLWILINQWWHKNVPEDLLGNAVVTAAYIWNRVTCQGLSKITILFQVSFCTEPALIEFLSFRIAPLVPNRKEGKKDLGDRGAPARNVGYWSNEKAYKQQNPKSQNLVLSRAVKFDEIADCIEDFTHSSSQKASRCPSDMSMQRTPPGKPLAFPQPLHSSVLSKAKIQEEREGFVNDTEHVLAWDESATICRPIRKRPALGEWVEAYAGLNANISDINIALNQTIRWRKSSSGLLQWRRNLALFAKAKSGWLFLEPKINTCYPPDGYFVKLPQQVLMDAKLLSKKPFWWHLNLIAIWGGLRRHIVSYS